MIKAVLILFYPKKVDPMEKKGVRYSSTQSIGSLINRFITRRLIRSRKHTRRISKSSAQRDLFFIFNVFLGGRDRATFESPKTYFCEKNFFFDLQNEGSAAA
ncbi:hypothetical protein TNIN_220111 [Trichonephila inaurata madagascariensis]|uniref:Uncharacterized protein n=1 Tax=Trichonephila inaurata madagascariensis TaxID=2747483 RepID=A0A8X7C7Q2_9ARAC|nr:hypothetical protein TNIN_220111 [Trichonephila inaurata madagascariensis]